MKVTHSEIVTLEKVIGGGQCLSQLADGRKVFVWGGLPGEQVQIDIYRQKTNYAEAVVRSVLTPSKHRIAPRDGDAYLSTSPWQIVDTAEETRYKTALVQEAFELHDLTLSEPVEIYGDEHFYNYRNKVEFSFWWDNDKQTLDLAFFQRGSHVKIAVDGTSLAREEINVLARAIRDMLRRKNTQARLLKTLLIRCDQAGNCVFQLYVKDAGAVTFNEAELATLGARGGEVILSDPHSPASIITKQLMSFGSTTIQDAVLNVPFQYVCEGFFQINLPVYEQALRDIQAYIDPAAHVVDIYSGVGTIGLTIGGDAVTLVESNASAVAEMRHNIEKLGKKHAKAIRATAESALEYITNAATVILDPPRAGLHASVIERLLAERPKRVIYLSCNPVTQARDIALLSGIYAVQAHRGYNFFPRTPHIEHLVVLDLR